MWYKLEEGNIKSYYNDTKEQRSFWTKPYCLAVKNQQSFHQEYKLSVTLAHVLTLWCSVSAGAIWRLSLHPHFPPSVSQFLCLWLVWPLRLTHCLLASLTQFFFLFPVAMQLTVAFIFMFSLWPSSIWLVFFISGPHALSPDLPSPPKCHPSLKEEANKADTIVPSLYVLSACECLHGIVWACVTVCQCWRECVKSGWMWTWIHSLGHNGVCSYICVADSAGLVFVGCLCQANFWLLFLKKKEKKNTWKVTSLLLLLKHYSCLY